MPSPAKKLIDSLRKCAITHGIAMSLSKERDRCANLFFARSYASTLAAEGSDALASPTINLGLAKAIVTRHGLVGEAFVGDARQLLKQYQANHSSQGRVSPVTLAVAGPDAMRRAVGSIHTEAYVSAVVTINYVVCRGNRLATDDLADAIRRDGLDVGYDLEFVFTDQGGDFDQPIVAIRAEGDGEQVVKTTIDAVYNLAYKVFDRLRDAAPKGKAPVYRDIEGAFDAEGVATWRHVSGNTYAFTLNGIATVISVEISGNATRGGYDYRLSHHIRIPGALSVYTPGRMWGDTPEYAMRQAVTALTHFHNAAVRDGHVPDASWLVAVSR
jgi:hypothetical protein